MWNGVYLGVRPFRTRVHRRPPAREVRLAKVHLVQDRIEVRAIHRAVRVIVRTTCWVEAFNGVRAEVLGDGHDLEVAGCSGFAVHSIRSPSLDSVDVTRT